MKINKDLLYKLYMQKVDEICEKCDWVDNFGPKEIVDMIVEIIENNQNIVESDTFSTELSKCPLCEEIAFDGYICHSCGHKKII